MKRKIFYADRPPRTVRDIQIGEEFYIPINETILFFTDEENGIGRLVFSYGTSAFYEEEIHPEDFDFFLKLFREEKSFKLIDELETKTFFLREKDSVFMPKKALYIEGEIRVFEDGIPLELLSQKELEFLLEKAVQEERYEEAARIKEILLKKGGI